MKGKENFEKYVYKIGQFSVESVSIYRPTPLQHLPLLFLSPQILTIYPTCVSIYCKACSIINYTSQ